MIIIIHNHLNIGWLPYTGKSNLRRVLLEKRRIIWRWRPFIDLPPSVSLWRLWWVVSIFQPLCFVPCAVAFRVDSDLKVSRNFHRFGKDHSRIFLFLKCSNVLTVIVECIGRVESQNYFTLLPHGWKQPATWFGSCRWWYRFVLRIRLNISSTNSFLLIPHFTFLEIALKPQQLRSMLKYFVTVWRHILIHLLHHPYDVSKFISSNFSMIRNYKRNDSN